MRGPRIPPSQLTVPEPIIVVEVLSPTTAQTDTSAKLMGYFKLASVRHYLVLDPEACTVTYHTRATDGAIASRSISAGRLRLEPPGVEREVTSLFG
jgi:Uma2 family endonuclease